MESLKKILGDQKIRHYIVVAIVVIILVFSFYVVRPSIIGYSVYNNAKDANMSVDTFTKTLSEIESELLDVQGNLSYCVDYNSKAFDQLEKTTDKLVDCNSRLLNEKNEFTDGLNEVNRELVLKEALVVDLRKEANTMEAEYSEKIEELESDYASLAKNSANNICCKMKVDNMAINSYKIDNDRIVCSENAENPIDC